MMRHQILGLLEIREHRGILGVGAREAWMIDALEILLRAELERIEKQEKKDERG